MILIPNKSSWGVFLQLVCGGGCPFNQTRTHLTDSCRHDSLAEARYHINTQYYSFKTSLHKSCVRDGSPAKRCRWIRPFLTRIQVDGCCRMGDILKGRAYTMYYCGYAKNIFTLFISDVIVCTHPQSNRLLLLPSSAMATLVNSSAVLLFPDSKSFLPEPYLDLHLPPLPEWSDFFLMTPRTITSLSVSRASVSCCQLAWAYDPTPTECFLPFKPPYIKGSCAGHMPLRADAAADQNPPAAKASWC